METIILQGASKANTRLMMQLAKRLKFKARKLTSEDIEDTGILISINEGLKSGFLDEHQKYEFIENLKTARSI